MENLLEIKSLNTYYGESHILRDVDLNVKSGEMVCLIGRNGVGKTTFLDVITGKVKPKKGEVIFKGKSLVGRKEHKIARLGVGRKFQSPRIFENLTVKENLEISVSTPKSPLNLINKSIKDEQLKEIERLMKIVNLAQKVDSKAGSLSHGQKQWLEIAMLVGQKPDLMLVDEPVAGLTDEETDLTADLLKSLSGENTVVVIDHDMEFIRRLDSNVSVLNQGTVLCEGTMETIQKDKKVIDVYLGRPED